MRKKGRMLPVLLLAALLTAGCRKGDGTERIPVPVKENSNADYFDSLFTDVTEDKNAKKDTPFSVSGAVRPSQDIVLVMIYDNTEEMLSHSQAVNYFDRDGNTYRYRHPVDLSGDWLSVLQEDYRAGATVVNIMSEEERNTIWALAAEADTLKNAPLKTKSPGKDIYGVTYLYLIDETNQPILLAQYDDTSTCCDTPEVIAFADWFRYFYHGDFTFGG
ncbi:MAG: hypothetical protein K6E36_00520 [Oscillospiraceae bacterium]|jgi:hypothetical protein|nr:hypothetical protein [Oscillospiraceae bacterium]MCR5304971.1 hypothetical protein [Oscillospiraceae bacterium]